MLKEKMLYELLAKYLQTCYPDVIYRFDLAADMKLTRGQAARHKRLHPHRGYPDLFIAEPRTIEINGDKYHMAGLFLELKKDGVRIFKKDGKLVSNAHIREQFDMLEELRVRGYMAEFACGLAEATRIINLYLGEPKEQEVEF